MNIVKELKVPTGKTLIVSGNHGKLEMLSIGDYEKNINLNQHKTVHDGIHIMTLTEK